MSTHHKHFKLGLFVILGAASALAIALGLGAMRLRHQTVTYSTFFNESVQGLDTGAPVKFRGVTIGAVARIEIAPDHRQVAVVHELDVQDIKRMDLTKTGKGGHEHFLIPPDLRAQLGSQGVTGVKFINIDFFDVKANPLPELPFPAPENYIPAAASLMKNLEDSIAGAVDRVPELVDAVVTIMHRVDRMALGLEEGHAIDKTVAAVQHADELLAGLSAMLKGVDAQRLPERAAGTFDRLNTAVNKMSKVLDRIDGETGLVAIAQRSIGDVGKSATGVSRELDDTLRDIREAASALRTLAESLDRDPDMLLKGRAKVKEESK